MQIETYVLSSVLKAEITELPPTQYMYRCVCVCVCAHLFLWCVRNQSEYAYFLGAALKAEIARELPSVACLAVVHGELVRAPADLQIAVACSLWFIKKVNKNAIANKVFFDMNNRIPSARRVLHR